MNALLSGLEHVLAGRGGLFLLAGEAGIGKSRLVWLLAFEEAVRLYGMALDALGRDGTATDRTRCELLVALADAESRAGDDLVGRNLSSWHVDSEWLFSITLLAEAGAMLGDGEHAAPLYDVLLPYGSLNAVAPIEAALGSASRALGMLATVLGRFADAARHYDEALRMNTRMGARPWVAHTEHDYAPMLVERGEPGDRELALELARRSLERYRSLGMDPFATEAAVLERAASVSRNGSPTRHL